MTEGVVMQWLMLGVLVLVALSAAGALGWLIGHKPEGDRETKDFDDAPDHAGADGEDKAEVPAERRRRTGAKKRKARGSALIAEPTFAPVTSPATSSDEVVVPAGVDWNPPALPEEYAATVINVEPINAGVLQARSAPTPVRPEDMPPAVRVRRPPTPPSVVPPPRQSRPVPPYPTSPHRGTDSAPSLSYASADPGYLAVSMSPDQITATSINEFPAITDSPGAVSPSQYGADQFDGDQIDVDQYQVDQYQVDQFDGDQSDGDQSYVDQYQVDQYQVDQTDDDQLEVDQIEFDQASSDAWPAAEGTGQAQAGGAGFEGLSPDELREELARAQIEMGRIEATATAAWDRTVPVLEDRISDLQLANAELEARVVELQRVLGGQAGGAEPRGRRANERSKRVSSGADRRS